MHTRTLLPAIASLVLVFASPAFAQGAAGPIGGFAIEKPASVVTLAAAKKKFSCRKFENYHERGRCREIHGIPDDMN